MIIKNLTSQVLSLRVKELLADHSYDITIQAKGCTEIDRTMEIVQLGSLLREKKVEVLSGLITPKEIVKETISDEPQVEIPVDDVETPQDSSTNEPQVEIPQTVTEPSVYICDICGAEFASARGLSSHKKKTHEE